VHIHKPDLHHFTRCLTSTAHDWVPFVRRNLRAAFRDCSGRSPRQKEGSCTLTSHWCHWKPQNWHSSQTLGACRLSQVFPCPIRHQSKSALFECRGSRVKRPSSLSWQRQVDDCGKLWVGGVKFARLFMVYFIGGKLVFSARKLIRTASDGQTHALFATGRGHAFASVKIWEIRLTKEAAIDKAVSRTACAT